MKATKIFMMAALALTFAACSNNDDIDLAQQPAAQPANGEITITATLEANDGASTRALSIDGSNIASTWKTTDQFAILYNNGTENTKSTATVKSINASTVTITFTIPATLANNTTCTIVYPASAANAANTGADVATALATQDGTIGNCPEVRVGTATIDKDNHNLSSVTKLVAQNAIFKFTLQDLSAGAKSATEFKVSDGSGNVMTTVTSGSASGELYVALPVMTAGTYWFNATIGEKPYIAKATTAADTEVGKYYQTTVKMATIGDVILSDGKFAAPSSTGTKVAMIAYLGNGSDCTNGLAIQLNASPEAKIWNDAKTYASGLTAVPGGTWRLPSKADWQNMFVGCAKSGDAGAGVTMDPIAGFKEKIGATGITWLSDCYWSSTGTGLSAWDVGVALDSSLARAHFYEDVTSYPFYVLGCLAF